MINATSISQNWRFQIGMKQEFLLHTLLELLTRIVQYFKHYILDILEKQTLNNP